MTFTLEAVMQARVVLVARVKVDGKYDFRPVTEMKRGRPVAPHGATTYYLRYSRNGKRVVEPVGASLDVTFTTFRNRELERTRLKRGLLPVNAEQYTPAPEDQAPETPLREAVDQYLKDCAAVGNETDTISKKTLVLRDFLKVCTEQEITTLEALKDTKIGRKALLAYLAWMKTNIPRVNVDGTRPENTYSGRMRKLGAFLKQHGIKIKKDVNAAPADPGLLAHHEFPKEKPRKPTKYSKEMVKAWLKAATLDEADLIWFFLSTGFRDDEVANIEWSDINFRDRTVNVHAKRNWKPKDDESRAIDIPLSADFIKRMEARRARYAGQKCQLVFPNKACKPNDNLLRIARRAAKRAGITERIGFHTIRKTFACYLAETHPIELVRQLLGHSDIATTQIYLSADDADVRKLKASIGDMKSAFSD
jgi:integrase